MEFRGYDTTEEVCDILTSHYIEFNGAKEHQLMVFLYKLTQELREHIIVFHSQMRFL